MALLLLGYKVHIIYSRFLSIINEFAVLGSQFARDTCHAKIRSAAKVGPGGNNFGSATPLVRMRQKINGPLDVDSWKSAQSQN